MSLLYYVGGGNRCQRPPPREACEASQN